MAELSVIVPIYNGAAHLSRCVESLQRQTLQELEIILVDDGSRDDSLLLSRRYAAQDSRIRVVAQENRGAGKARQTGVECAQTEFVCFLDCDDWAEPDFCRRMLRAQQETDADLTECAYWVADGESRKVHRFFQENKTLNRMEFLDQVVASTIVGGREAVVAWNKLYRRKLLQKLVSRWDAEILEDYLMNLQYYVEVSRYAYLTEPLICYCMTEGSLSRSYRSDFYPVLQSVAEQKQACMLKMGLNSQKYQKIHSRWYLDYVENYLVMGLCTGSFSNTMQQVLKDDMLLAAAQQAPAQPLGAYLKRNDLKGGWAYIKGRSRKMRQKLWLHRIKIRLLKLLSAKNRGG